MKMLEMYKIYQVQMPTEKEHDTTALQKLNITDGASNCVTLIILILTYVTISTNAR